MSETEYDRTCDSGCYTRIFAGSINYGESLLFFRYNLGLALRDTFATDLPNEHAASFRFFRLHGYVRRSIPDSWCVQPYHPADVAHLVDAAR